MVAPHSWEGNHIPTCLWFLPSTFPDFLMNINSKSFAIRGITKLLLIAFCLSFFWGPWVTKSCQGVRGHLTLLSCVSRSLPCGKHTCLVEQELPLSEASGRQVTWAAEYVPMPMTVDPDGLPRHGPDCEDHRLSYINGNNTITWEGNHSFRVNETS